MTINWLLEPAKDLASVPLRKGFLTSIFSQSASRLGYRFFTDPYEQPSDDSGMLPNVLMHTGSFTLKVASGLAENAINPITLEGGGEIRSEHGHKPLLMLLLLQKRWREEFNTSEGDAVELCDEQGELLDLSRWDSLAKVAVDAGFDTDQVREDAEAIGLIVPLIRLDKIDVDIDDCFF